MMKVVLCLTFSPAGRRWPEGSDEGGNCLGSIDFSARGIPLIRLSAPSPPRGEGGARQLFHLICDYLLPSGEKEVLR
ncbi:hypothetical protein FBZ98_103759 [Rhizobium sp. ERR 922]|nr:hypothetical protein FBZ98_103759 [Rhizobium sp. ERR 922]TWB97302.1 hypothetical protein FBZ97_103124 [Rhizobium sp. ERR 942]